jgi:hypothetical protein
LIDLYHFGVREGFRSRYHFHNEVVTGALTAWKGMIGITEHNVVGGDELPKALNPAVHK